MKNLSKEQLKYYRWLIYNPKSEKYELTNYHISFTEYKILTLIMHQKTCKEIASILNKNIRTVEGHRYNLLRKTNSTNSVGLSLFCFKNKLL